MTHMTDQAQSAAAKILIVDDMPVNLKLLAQVLTDEGYSVRPAKNGTLALSSIQLELPDLILLDVMMPDLSGYEVCERVKADERTRDIPVLFLSAKTDVLDKVRAFELGAVDYITKPFQTEEVLARVQTHLTIRTLQQQLQEEKDRFRSLTEAAHEGLLIHEQGRIVDLNPAFESLMGYTRTELVGRDDLPFFPPQSQAVVQERITAGGEQPFEVAGQHKDGRLVPLEVHGKALSNRPQTLGVLAIRDISWRKTLQTLEEKSRQLESENLSLKATLRDRDHLGELWGSSPAMQKVYERIIRAAASDETVVIYGETGTGKELAAHTIFELSDGHAKTFVAANCGAIPEHLVESQLFGYRKGAFTDARSDRPGYFDRAQGGMLFLDEVGELPLAIQVKLLRVLEDGSYAWVGDTRTRRADVRIVAATNRELRDMVRAGTMREDFFHRLHVIALELPPLRHRKEDLPLLIQHFLTHYPQTDLTELPPEIHERFLAYDWPGNVRELFNELRRYVTVGEVELRGEVPPENASSTPAWQPADGLTFTEQVEALEKYLIAEALNTTQGNKTHAAAQLQLPIMTLRRKLKKYNLE